MEGALQSGVSQQRNVEDVVQVHEDLVPETKVKANQKRKRGSYSRVLVCMYLLIGKGQSAQKRPYWGENRIKRKIHE